MYDDLLRQLDATSTPDPALIDALVREARRRNDVDLLHRVGRRAHGCAAGTCLLPTVIVMSDGDDAEGFGIQLAHLLEGVLDEHAPERVSLVKIDNWFSAKWQGFTRLEVVRGLGSPGAEPPFRDKRIRGERALARAGQGYVEVEPPRLKRRKKRAASLADDRVYVWYSGNTAYNRRGCVMLYVPFDEPDFLSTTHWMAYLELEQTAQGWSAMPNPSVPEAQVKRWLEGPASRSRPKDAEMSA